MKPLRRSVAIGAIAAIAVFAGTFTWQYWELKAHQPGVVPMSQATSFPPSAAWLFAAPWAVVAFVAAATCAFGVIKLRKKEPPETTRGVSQKS